MCNYLCQDTAKSDEHEGNDERPMAVKGFHFSILDRYAKKYIN